ILCRLWNEWPSRTDNIAFSRFLHFTVGAAVFDVKIQVVEQLNGYGRFETPMADFVNVCDVLRSVRIEKERILSIVVSGNGKGGANVDSALPQCNGRS